MTIMVGLIVATLGAVSLTRLPIDLMPPLRNMHLRVDSRYPGAGPYEIETLITRPLEQSLSTVHHVKKLSSTSAEGSSRVNLEFQWGTNTDNAYHDMRQAIERISDQLPEDLPEPVIEHWDPADAPIIYLAIASDLDPVGLTRFVTKDIVPHIERIPGVARIRVDGGVRREIRVELNRDDLHARGLSASDVIAALRQENAVQQSGNVDKGHLRLLLRTHGNFKSLDEISGTIIARDGDALVRVSDVGRVVKGTQRQTLIQRTDGEPSIALQVYKQSGLNTVEVCDAVERAIRQFNAQHNEAKISVRINTGQHIRKAIEDVGWALLLGMGLSGLVLLIFLRSFRSTLVVALSMPLSVLMTLVMIYLVGYTLNLVSFGGLALGIGLLVDNSIVVLENIFRKRHDGLAPDEAAIEGTGEVSAAITASTLTTLVVFLPVLFLVNAAGVLLYQLAFAVSISVVSSLLISMTLTPMLTTLGAREAGSSEGESSKSPPKKVVERRKPSGPTAQPAQRPGGLRRSATGTRVSLTERAYGRLLGWSLRHPAFVSAALLSLFACAVGLTPLIGTEFLPNSDGGTVRVDIEMAPGIQLDLLDHQARILEDHLVRMVPECQTLFARVGGPPSASTYWHRGTMLVGLVPTTERTRTAEEIRQDLEDNLPAITGMKYNIRAYKAISAFGSLGRGGGTRMLLELRGGDPQEAQIVAAEVVADLEEIPGLANVKVSKDERREVLAAGIDRHKASVLGVSASDLAGAISSSVRGTRAAVFHDKGDELEVVVRLREEDRSQKADVGELGVTTADGNIVPVKSLVSFAREEDSAAIRRSDQQRVTTITASIEDRDLGSIAKDIEHRLTKTTLPDGYSIHVTGDWELQQKNFRDLRIGMALAVVLMFMVMAAQFESLLHPLLVLLTLPLAAIGVIATLLLTGSHFNLQTFIGIVMLSGIVVNNAIVLIDYINQLRKTHPDKPLQEVVIQAATRRFRPILMTTVTTVLAMSPIAFAWGESGEVQAPMALSLIGGLISATLITLVAIPLAYAGVSRNVSGEESTE